MYKVISNNVELKEFFEALDSLSVDKSSRVALDIETTGLDCFSDKVILIQFGIKSTQYIIDCRKLEPKMIKYSLERVANSYTKVILHNAGFDLKFLLYQYGVEFRNVADTMLTEIMVCNGLLSKKNRMASLKTLVEKYIGIVLDKETRSAFINNYDVELTNEVLNYSALDVAYLEQIYSTQLKKIEEQKQMRALQLEEQVIPVVVAMEVAGIRIDVDMWKALVEKSVTSSAEAGVKLVDSIVTALFDKYPGISAYEYATKLAIPVKTKRDITALSQLYDTDNVTAYLKTSINLNSPKQVIAVLREVYGLDIENTNEKTIKKLTRDNPIVGDILSYRGDTKSATSFGDNYLDKVHPVTGKIHASFNQLGADSGRFSSSSPNMQNIKSESEYRDCFIPDSEDYVFVCADFSQQELRILAAVANEKRMQEAFANGIDLHTSTAALLYNIPVDQVTKEQRRHAKALNFALSYGSSEYGLEQNFDIDLETGRDLIDNYYNQVYTSVKAFKEEMRKAILEKYYSTTMLGRKRFFERKIMFVDYKEVRRHENSIVREGINHVIQGTSADATKMAMVAIHFNNPYGDKLKLLVQVHDEVVVMVHKSIAEAALIFVTDCMLSAEKVFLGDAVPPAVEAHIASKWEH